MRKQASTWFLLALAGLALYLSFLVARPFLNPIFAAIVLAIVFYPLHARMLSAIRSPNVASAVSTILVILIVAIPAVLVGLAVTRELGELYQSLSQKSAAQGGVSPYLMHLTEAPLRVVGRYVNLSRLDLRSNLLDWVEGASRYAVAVGATAVSNIFSLIFAIVVVFFTLFFLFRDGLMVKQRMIAVIPLTEGQATTLFRRVSETIVASVYGGIAVGLVQGSLTGIAFWILGLPSPVLWGIVASITSLIPVVGTGMVWVPGALVLLLGGHWIKGLILLGWGGAVVAQIDALVRPYVVSGRAKMHNLLIFFALLGGVKAFGIMGLFIGPVVVSITIAVLDMLREVKPFSEEAEPRERTAGSGAE